MLLTHMLNKSNYVHFFLQFVNQLIYMFILFNSKQRLFVLCTAGLETEYSCTMYSKC